MTESIDYLTLDDVLEVADGIIDGVLVRDMGLLASAVARPQTTVFGEDAYPTLSDKAAALMHSLACNHALVDGNKRLAWAATRVSCLLNGHDVQFASVDEAESMVLAVAAGDLDVPALASLLADHIIESA